MNESDEQLVTAYKAGREGAFTELVARHIDGLYGFAFRLTGSREAAEDIVQDSSVKAWRSIDRFREGERWKTWIYAIARNTAIDHLRKKRSLSFSDLELASGDNPVVDNLEGDEPLPNELAMRIEDKQLMERALADLSPLYREVLYLYYYEDMTLAEVATLLDRPIDTVKSQHRRGLAAMKIILSDLLKQGNAPNYPNRS
jgi:RNA polymerase sigma-70 factor (ECF subfamily)